MRSTSRQARTRLAVALAAAASVCVGAPAVGANPPSDVRVVSTERSAGLVNVVVSVPSRLVATVGTPGGLTVEGPGGQPLDATIAPLAASDTALAVIVHAAGAPPADWAKAYGTTAELLRSLDPGTPVTLVTTSGGAVVAPLSADHAVPLAALGRPVVDAPAALPDALGAIAGQLAGHNYVDPLVVVVDAGLPTESATLPAQLPAVPGATVRIIPVGQTPSPLAGQLAQRLGVPVTAGSDPVALVDDAVGLLRGRFRLSVADPGGGPLTVRLHGGDADLTAAVTLPAVATTPAPGATSTVPTVLAERSAPAGAASRPTATAVAAAASATEAASSWPVVAGLVAIAVAIAVAVVVVRRRRARSGPRADFDASAPIPTRVVAGYYYTDFSDPSTARTPRRRRATVPRSAGSKVVAPADAAAGRDVPDLVVPEVGEAPPPEPQPAEPRPALPSAALPAAAPRAISPYAPPEKNGATAPTPTPAPVAQSGADEPGADEPDDRRVRVLKLAEQLGNISEACRIVGVSRRSFYEWKRVADTYGIEALRAKRGSPG